MRALAGHVIVAGLVCAAVACSSPRKSGANDAATIDAVGLPKPPASELSPAGPEVDGWEETIGGVACRHPKVEASCAKGFCRVPAGCFVMGSPSTELSRGKYTEEPTVVTLTRPFEMAQHELTRAEWSKLVPMLPEKPEGMLDSRAPCTRPECPVMYVSWFEALAFANLASERHAPQLAPCFELSGCEGELGRGMRCTRVALRAASIHECEGYRPPTEAEWEYAARAGTRTTYYTGDITYAGGNVTDVASFDLPEPMLDPIAWYKTNSGDATHPVGHKRPNRFGLFDVLGNVWEWTTDSSDSDFPAGPLTDPTTGVTLREGLGPSGNPLLDTRVAKGGEAGLGRSHARAAGRTYPPPDSVVSGIGLRLVRTLRE